MSSKRFLRCTLGFLFLGAGLVTSCSGGDYAILVRVTGRPADTTALSATVKLGDQYALQSIDVVPPTPLDYVGIRLPADKSGMLTVEVSALGTDQCKAASGTVTVDLDEGRGQEVTVNLAALSPRRCSLIIEQSGEGSVSVTPAGTPCGTGCYDFNQGQTAVLKFNATGKSYGAQTYVSSGGICDGYNDCSVNVAKRVRAEVKFQPRLCSLSKWCWYHPLPQGNGLNGMWGTGPTDIWAVGDFGTALHYDGQNWSLLTTGTTRHLNGIWTPGAGSAVVVGDTGFVSRWNGSAFVNETSGTTAHLNSVWGSSLSNLFAVGDGGVILRNMGGSWSAMSSGTVNNLFRVHGTDPQNAWAVGQAGTVRNFTGTTWSTVTGPGSMVLTDVWTSGPNDVWAVGGTTGGDCGVFRRDGVMWKTSNPCKAGLTAVWGNSPRDVFAAGGELTISRFVESDVAKFVSPDILTSGSLKGLIPTYRAAWGHKEGEVYLATGGGNVLRYVASPPSTQLAGPLPFVTARGSGELVVATGAGSTEYFLYDDGTVFGTDGRKLSVLPPVPVITSVYDGYTAPTGELFVGGTAGNVYKYTPATNTWTSMKAGTITSTVFAVGGVSANDFYVGTSFGSIYRYASGALPTGSIYVTASASIQSIWGRTSSEVWAVGGTEGIKINNGVATKQAAVPTVMGDNLIGVGGPPSPSSHVWMVGALGLVIRYNGTSWTKVPSGVTSDLNTVAALSETDVWIAGDGGVVLRWDGTSLKPVAGPFGDRNLTKIHSPAANDLWLVGYGNAVWRYMP